MALPSVIQTIESNGLGQSQAPVTDRCCVIGCSSAGTEGMSKLYAGRQVAKLVSDQGYGPGPQAVALHLARGQSCLYYKVPSTNPGTQGVDGSDNATTLTGSGSSTVSLSGAALDDYELLVKVLVGGDIGDDDPNITLQVSLDNGRNYQPRIALGVNTTYLIPNSGITLNFGVGTLVAGDVITTLAIAPKWDSADLTQALSDIGASFPAKPFGFIHIVGPMNATEAAVVKSSLGDLEAGTIYTSALIESRRPEPEEDEDTWMQDIIDDYASFSSERIGRCDGTGLLVSPIDGNDYMRPLGFDAAVRGAAIEVEQELGRVRSGPMAISIVNSDNDLIAHDERVSPGLDEARGITLMTIPGLIGVYVANGNLLSPSGSDFTLWPFRRVMDLVSTITYQNLVLELSDNVRISRATGLILEEEALRIENAVNQVLYERVVKPGHAISAQLILSRNDDLLSTSTLTSETIVVPVPIVKTIENVLRFENPALNVSVA